MNLHLNIFSTELIYGNKSLIDAKTSNNDSGQTRGPEFVLFMQIITFSTYKTEPNLQVKTNSLHNIKAVTLKYILLWNRQNLRQGHKVSWETIGAIEL